jgi:hypothetical protein
MTPTTTAARMRPVLLLGIYDGPTLAALAATVVAAAPWDD